MSPEQIVLGGIGVVQFVVLLFALLYQALHRRRFATLLWCFLVPIATIGYPTIKSIQVSNAVTTLGRMSDELRQKPEDRQLRQALGEKVEDLAPTVAKFPRGTLALAKAQFALGREDDAMRNLLRLSLADASQPAALALRANINEVKQLQILAPRVHADPRDQAMRADLQRTLDSAILTNAPSPNAVAAIAQAQSAIGQHERAKASIDRAVKISPNAANLAGIREWIARNAVR
jgi:tetratricopeptide (TPR) repeat protein